MRKTIDFISTPDRNRTDGHGFRKPKSYRTKDYSNGALASISAQRSVAVCSSLQLHKILSRGTPQLRPSRTNDPDGLFIWGYRKQNILQFNRSGNGAN